MKRKVRIPHPVSEVYRAVLDPIRLSVWLDRSYVSTGSTPLHLFEIGKDSSSDEVRFRGFIVEAVPDRKIRIEKEEHDVESFRALVLLFQESEGCCEMEVAWSSSKLDEPAQMFLDPKGHRRLGWAIEQFPRILPDEKKNTGRS